MKRRFALIFLVSSSLLLLTIAFIRVPGVLADDFLKGSFSLKVENVKAEFDAASYSWAEESKIKYAEGSDYFYFWIPMDLLGQTTLSINGANFSGLASGVSPFKGKEEDPDGTIDGSLKITGTYENGVLDGTWKYTGTVTHDSAGEAGSNVTDRIEASGSIKSHGPVTTDGVDGTFEGSVKAFQTHLADDFSGILGEDSPSPLGNYPETDEETDNKAFFHLQVTGAPAQPVDLNEEDSADEGEAGPVNADEGKIGEILPGINGIGDIPGPDSLPEAAIGLLIPGIIGVFGGLVAGGGGTGLAEPPTGEEPEGPEEPSSDEEAASRSFDPATRHAKNVLDIFDKRTQLDKNPELKELADKARETAFDADGKVIPEKWNEIKDQMRDAIITHAGDPGEVSIVREHIDGVINSAEQAKDIGGDLLTGIGDYLKKGFGGIADGIMHPADFFRGVREGVLDWSHQNTEDWRQFGDKLSHSFKEEGPGSAIQVLTESLVDSEKKLWGGIWQTGKELLPVEEIESLFDEKASLEERLWAVPAAASKIAGLLVGTELGNTRVPGLGDATLIPSERAAAAAAEEAAATSATRATEAKTAKSSGIGKTTRAPSAMPEAEAGTEAAAREAEKSAARLAEDVKGDKARAAAEQRFSDPAQKAGYQSDYQQYMDNAQKKADAVADTVKSGKAPDVAQALDNMADPAAMRDLKTAPADVRKGFIETQNKIFEPTNREVESFLSEKYPGEEFKVEGVRTPGKNYDPATSINTDNDVHAVRKVIGKDGSVSWKEVPGDEWKQAYHDSFAKNSNFTVDSARNRFPDVDWDHLTAEQQSRKWGELHQQEPGDVFDATSGRDFRKTSQGGAGVGPDDSAHAAAKRGEGKLTDAEQLGMMEREKFSKEWNKGTIPHQKEALEQLSKKGREVESLIEGYQKHSQVSELSPKMKEALKIIEDNNLSPLDRAQKVKDLGFAGGPQEVSDMLSSKIESLKIARPK